MEINFKISIRNLVNFHMNHVSETKIYKDAMIGFLIYLILIFILVFLVTHNSLYIVVTFFTELIIFLFRKKIFNYKLRKRFFKLYVLYRYKNNFEESKLSVTSDGIKLSTSLGINLYKWVSIKSVHRIDNYIFIRTFNNNDLLIPMASPNISEFESKNLFLDTVIENTKLKLENTYPVDIKFV